MRQEAGPHVRQGVEPHMRQEAELHASRVALEAIMFRIRSTSGQVPSC